MKNKINTSVRVLIYKENNEYVAHCLEMDLKGYGKTKTKALKELNDLINMQISFAIQKKQPSLIWFPAEPKYFLLYEQLKEKYFKTLKKDKDFEVNDLIISNNTIVSTKERYSYAENLQV